MASFMDRLREAFGVPMGHADEHGRIAERISDHQIRLDRLDATVDATIAKERRRVLAATHPRRRAEDRP